MKVEIVEKKENPLLERLEIKFRVDHSSAPTPRRLEVRSQLAAELGTDEELVVIQKLASTMGRQVASGIARVYFSRERLEELEPKYLFKRDMPKEVKPEKRPEKQEAKMEEKRVGGKGG